MKSVKLWIIRPLPSGKNIKVIELMRDEIGGKITTDFAPLRPKTYSYLIDDNDENKKSKSIKLRFKDYKSFRKQII